MNPNRLFSIKYAGIKNIEWITLFLNYIYIIIYQRINLCLQQSLYYSTWPVIIY